LVLTGDPRICAMALTPHASFTRLARRVPGQPFYGWFTRHVYSRGCFSGLSISPVQSKNLSQPPEKSLDACRLTGVYVPCLDKFSFRWLAILAKLFQVVQHQPRTSTAG